MSTTDTGVPLEDTGLDDDAAIEAAFSKAFGEDAETPSDAKADEDETDEQSEDEGSKDEAETEDDDGDEKSTEDDEDEGEDEEANDDNVVVKDDYKVKVTVDGAEKEFTIGNLKRLAGQEAALTQKSQKVATQRTELDRTAATQLAAYNRLLDNAKKKAEPYAKIDLLALSRDANISTEELTAIRDAQQNAFAELRFIEQEMGGFQQELQKQRQKELQEQAIETVKVLSDPEKGIPGFGEKLYGDLVSFAKTQGVTDDAANEIVDPISLRILHKAMLYDRGVKKVKEETDPKTTSKKVEKKAPKKIVKRITNTDENKKVMKGGKGDKEQDALRRLQRSGSDEDAQAAFEAMFGRDED